jgi:hypothetical protein
LSVHPEWAWAIIFGRKDVENRSWSTKYRGTLLIHASSRKNSSELLENAREAICESSGIPTGDLPDVFPNGSILGAVELIDCVAGADSSWAGEGFVHWLFRNPQPFEHPVGNVMGKLQIWRWTPTTQQVRESGGSGSTIAPRVRGASKTPPKRPAKPQVARSIDGIPADEILSRLCACASAKPANEVEIIRAASRALGFARMGSRVEQVLKSYVKQALNQKLIISDARGIRTGTRG